ncbi:PREDICTED: ly6/PLAUR domain-containing protein 2 [Myotis davidii]|uniref:ly6/PLAUR domain-containing protein 2 n=1 Tax=Myotis davidii TaxID=225400 RepID=UPI0003EC4831|nr:PREDICTED: ly6/PLAUR domain-containing protein 2 [Myotis davidii]
MVLPISQRRKLRLARGTQCAQCGHQCRWDTPGLPCPHPGHTLPRGSPFPRGQLGPGGHRPLQPGAPDRAGEGGACLTPSCHHPAVALQCFTCQEPTGVFSCVLITTCKANETMCKTTLYSREIVYPFLGDVMVTKTCASKCVPSDVDGIGLTRPVSCCHTDLCNVGVGGAPAPRGPCGLALALALAFLLSLPLSCPPPPPGRNALEEARPPAPGLPVFFLGRPHLRLGLSPEA